MNINVEIAEAARHLVRTHIEGHEEIKAVLAQNAGTSFGFGGSTRIPTNSSASRSRHLDSSMSSNNSSANLDVHLDSSMSSNNSSANLNVHLDSSSGYVAESVMCSPTFDQSPLI